MLILCFLLLIAGFVALIKGADLFVDGSAALARNFHVPGLVIGLTIVALGTSAPELAVSTSAALQGSNEIALSNVVGSNIFNLLCVLGACAVVHPVPVDRSILRRDLPLSILASVFVLLAAGGPTIFSGRFLRMGMGENAGIIARPVGAVLLAVFIAYIVWLIRDAKKHPAQEEAGYERKSTGKCLLLIVIGLALIVGGGQAVVYSAKEIARAAGLTETLIGLTVVAMGTSLPELVTSVVAARKGETGLAIGNVVGSNLFNLMLILGLSSLIHPVAVNFASVCDLAVLIAISVVSYFFARSSRTVNRAEGVALLLIYFADLIFAIVR